MSETISVVLVDDQELFRSGVAVVVNAHDGLAVVGQAGNGQHAIEVVAECEPDVVLMDIRMPVMDGVQAVQALYHPDLVVARTKPLRTIMLTTFNLDEAAATAIRAGASGFLMKDASAESLCAAIRAVHAGNAVLSPTELGELFEHGQSITPPRVLPEQFGLLTERERAIFARAATGLSNSEIAAEEYLSESTVKTHISSVLAKLQLRDRVQLVVFAHEYRLLD
ncbi:response regulator [Lysinibacter cavernae]|uniref:DNA-binding NarL/FixJ family response regulator n=1 Tax=Lysinibacter cavernae TaxID=1640652 RepID=A0A7X5QZI9_9MICO|nr:response regulator transcription factor [Lysinibacter cavernae]NIH52904.1 DNA-binding NarL/FixJ family response regulator [Lysinibacter cavernae]